jgi:hypothetical protein
LKCRGHLPCDVFGGGAASFTWFVRETAQLCKDKIVYIAFLLVVGPPAAFGMFLTSTSPNLQSLPQLLSLASVSWLLPLSVPDLKENQPS